MAFDSVEMSVGTGGVKVIGDSFDDSGTTRFAPGSFLVYGADGGPYTRVNASAGLPVAQQGTWNVAVSNASIPVTDNGGSLTVDGTVAATQSGTWNVAVSNASIPVTDNGGSLTVDGTVNVVQGSSWSIDDGGGSVTVDGAVAISGTVPVTDNGGSLTIDGTVAATQSGTWNVAAVTSITNVVHVDDNSGSLTVDGTVAAAQSGTWNVATVTTLTGITNVVHIDDNGGSLTVDGTVAATQSGTWNVATVTTVSTVTAVTTVGTITNVVHVDDNSGSLTVDGTVTANPQPVATGGLDVVKTLDLDEQKLTIKTTAGCLYKIRVTNRTSSPRYLRLYNALVANVTIGSTAPYDIIPIPGNATDYTVLTESFGGMGLAFGTAISAAATTGFADNDSGAPGTNDLIASFYYK